MRRPDGSTERERVLPLFFVVFGLIFLRYCYYGLQYFPQLDDYIQLHNHPAYHSARRVILEQGLLSSRPLAAVGDYFLWSRFWGNLIAASAVLSALYAGSALLFRRVWSAYFGTGCVFLTVYALLPLGMEGAYWISAANRILPSLFFTALAMRLFQRWCREGKVSTLALYAPVQLLSYCFYEQGLVLSVTGVLLVAILERREQRRRSLAALLTFVNAAVYFAFTGYFAAGGGQLGERMQLLLPWQEGWERVFYKVLAQGGKAFFLGGGRTLAVGFRRGLSILLTDFNPLWMALLLALCAALFWLARRGDGGRDARGALVTGFLMALAPVTVFFVLAKPALPLRATVFSFCGLALMADVFVGRLLRRSARRGAAAALCAALAFVFSVASVSELHDYRQTYLDDRRAGTAVIAALEGGRGLNPALKVGVLNLEPSYLSGQNFPHLEHIVGATGSEWAFTGLLSCMSGNPDFPYTTPIPAGAEADLSRFDLLLWYDPEGGAANPCAP